MKSDYAVNDRRWTFPEPTTLLVDELCMGAAVDVVRLLTTSPKIKWLESSSIFFDDAQWPRFTAVLGRCPCLTTITGLQIKMDQVGCREGLMIKIDQFGRISELKSALNSHWDTPETKGEQHHLLARES
ncbi:unnamed protein product [Vitrella brassicaformis CCMP3155]|uniref:Uncharacterized protein n=1 Tax=Vitrella brassicaformis (strain CCMP3155) TaxID=1169540 RepID=A0A0G4H5B2_VITBC|nr:unnamed protein product [Vitrella brassicaformis CCMP3155]|eukprot:CEM38975.1 unnamed protein product [Vitrella brassicaformis CCMP3155]